MTKYEKIVREVATLFAKNHFSFQITENEIETFLPTARIAISLQAEAFREGYNYNNKSKEVGWFDDKGNYYNIPILDALLIDKGLVYSEPVHIPAFTARSHEYIQLNKAEECRHLEKYPRSDGTLYCRDCGEQ